MRDILLTLIVLVIAPLSFRFPWFGVISWTWVSLMYPQRLAFGFAHSMPIAAIVGGATLVGFMLFPAGRKMPRGAVPFVLFLFVVWMCFTSVFALYPSEIGTMFVKVMKIQLMTFVAMALLHERKHVEAFVWIAACSLGFYGIKGGLFTLRGGGVGSVQGPPGSFIAPNNELGLALTMSVPLMFYLFSTARYWWIKWGMTGAMILTSLAVLGTHSRGALLAILAMGAFLWLKNPSKIRNGIILLVIAVGSIGFMPDTWTRRMETIETYQSDSSAEGRINAWMMSWHLALDRPIGGGFEVITPEMFQRYAPDPTNVRAAHSIYFQVLGEHGFPGLFLFLLLWFLGWRMASRIEAMVVGHDDLAWAGRLALMVQVSMIAYFVGGAFLSLAYFDLPYDLLVILVALRTIVDARVAAPVPADGANAPARAGVPETHAARASGDA